MYLLRPGIKEDPVRRWALPDRAFFAAGACHVLAQAFLDRFPGAGFRPIWVRPRAGFTGNHVFVTNGDLAFDYHGYVHPDRLVAHHTKRARRLFRAWEADLVPVTVSLVNREAARAIGMDIREPAQFLHDALPRAQSYLDRFDHRILRCRELDGSMELFEHVAAVYHRLERLAAANHAASITEMRLAVLFHEEPTDRLPSLLGEAGFPDFAPAVVGVIGGFGQLWKAKTDQEMVAYVAAHKANLPALLLFELAHEGRATPQMERAAEIADLSVDFNRWVARLTNT